MLEKLYLKSLFTNKPLEENPRLHKDKKQKITTVVIEKIDFAR